MYKVHAGTSGLFCCFCVIGSWSGIARTITWGIVLLHRGSGTIYLYIYISVYIYIYILTAFLLSPFSRPTATQPDSFHHSTCISMGCWLFLNDLEPSCDSEEPIVLSVFTHTFEPSSQTPYTSSGSTVTLLRPNPPYTKMGIIWTDCADLARFAN